MFLPDGDLDTTLWNSGSEESPMKTKYDPCPVGWRVPTHTELSELSKNYFWGKNSNSVNVDYLFTGLNSYSDKVSQISLYACGYRDYCGVITGRNNSGYYWSSSLNYLSFYRDEIRMNVSSIDCTKGLSVRCVQNESEEPDNNDSDEEELYVAAVNLNISTLKIFEGDIAQLNVKVMPTDAMVESLNWSSNDSSIATVDQNGLIRAVSVGKVEIYVSAGGVVATCVVEVLQKDIAVDYIDEYGINHGEGKKDGV